MVTGRKIETFLTFAQRGAQFVVTKHAVVSDLHPTKGWRTIARHKEHQVRSSAPDRAEIAANTSTLFEGRRAS